MQILKYPETGTPFIKLNEKDYKENDYSLKKITDYFVSACSSLIEIFDRFNSNYKQKAENEVNENNIESEKAYLFNLSKFARLLKSILENPLDKSKYNEFIELEESLNWVYAGVDDEINERVRNFEYERYLRTHGLKDDRYYGINNDEYEKMIKEDINFKDFKSINLLKYGKFLCVMSTNIYCYLCLYYENLNKKYYFRFEHLIRDEYNYSYFTIGKNPNLLQNDKELINYCYNYCSTLENLSEQWEKENE